MRPVSNSEANRKFYTEFFTKKVLDRKNEINLPQEEKNFFGTLIKNENYLNETGHAYVTELVNFFIQRNSSQQNSAELVNDGASIASNFPEEMASLEEIDLGLGPNADEYNEALEALRGQYKGKDELFKKHTNKEEGWFEKISEELTDKIGKREKSAIEIQRTFRGHHVRKQMFEERAQIEKEIAQMGEEDAQAKLSREKLKQLEEIKRNKEKAENSDVRSMSSVPATVPNKKGDGRQNEKDEITIVSLDSEEGKKILNSIPDNLIDNISEITYTDFGDDISSVDSEENTSDTGSVPSTNDDGNGRVSSEKLEENDVGIVASAPVPAHNPTTTPTPDPNSTPTPTPNSVTPSGGNETPEDQLNNTFQHQIDELKKKLDELKKMVGEGFGNNDKSFVNIQSELKKLEESQRELSELRKKQADAAVQTDVEASPAAVATTNPTPVPTTNTAAGATPTTPAAVAPTTGASPAAVATPNTVAPAAAGATTATGASPAAGATTATGASPAAAGATTAAVPATINVNLNVTDIQRRFDSLDAKCTQFEKAIAAATQSVADIKASLEKGATTEQVENAKKEISGVLTKLQNDINVKVDDVSTNLGTNINNVQSNLNRIEGDIVGQVADLKDDIARNAEASADYFTGLQAELARVRENLKSLQDDKKSITKADNLTIDDFRKKAAEGEMSRILIPSVVGGEKGFEMTAAGPVAVYDGDEITNLFRSHLDSAFNNFDSRSIHNSRTRYTSLTGHNQPSLISIAKLVNRPVEGGKETLYCVVTVNNHGVGQTFISEEDFQEEFAGPLARMDSVRSVLLQQEMENGKIFDMKQILRQGLNGIDGKNAEDRERKREVEGKVIDANYQKYQQDILKDAQLLVDRELKSQYSEIIELVSDQEQKDRLNKLLDKERFTDLLAALIVDEDKGLRSNIFSPSGLVEAKDKWQTLQGIRSGKSDKDLHDQYAELAEMVVSNPTLLYQTTNDHLEKGNYFELLSALDDPQNQALIDNDKKAEFIKKLLSEETIKDAFSWSNVTEEQKIEIIDLAKQLKERIGGPAHQRSDYKELATKFSEAVKEVGFVNRIFDEVTSFDELTFFNNNFPVSNGNEERDHLNKDIARKLADGDYSGIRHLMTDVGNSCLVNKEAVNEKLAEIDQEKTGAIKLMQQYSERNYPEILEALQKEQQKLQDEISARKSPFLAQAEANFRKTHFNKIIDAVQERPNLESLQAILTRGSNSEAALDEVIGKLLAKDSTREFINKAIFKGWDTATPPAKTTVQVINGYESLTNPTLEQKKQFCTDILSNERVKDSTEMPTKAALRKMMNEGNDITEHLFDAGDLKAQFAGLFGEKKADAEEACNKYSDPDAKQKYIEEQLGLGKLNAAVEKIQEYKKAVLEGRERRSPDILTEDTLITDAIRQNGLTKQISAKIAAKASRIHSDDYHQTKLEIATIKTAEATQLREYEKSAFLKLDPKLRSVVDLKFAPPPAQGVSFQRGARNQYAVMFNGNFGKVGDPDSTGYKQDIGYVPIIGIPNVFARATVCTAKNLQEKDGKYGIMVCNNGVEKFEEHKIGDVVIDHNTIFHKQDDGAFKPIGLGTHLDYTGKKLTETVNVLGSVLKTATVLGSLGTAYVTGLVTDKPMFESRRKGEEVFGEAEFRKIQTAFANMQILVGSVNSNGDRSFSTMYKGESINYSIGRETTASKMLDRAEAIGNVVAVGVKGVKTVVDGSLGAASGAAIAAVSAPVVVGAGTVALGSYIAGDKQTLESSTKIAVEALRAPIKFGEKAYNASSSITGYVGNNIAAPASEYIARAVTAGVSLPLSAAVGVGVAAPAAAIAVLTGSETFEKIASNAYEASETLVSMPFANSKTPTLFTNRVALSKEGEEIQFKFDKEGKLHGGKEDAIQVLDNKNGIVTFEGNCRFFQNKYLSLHDLADGMELFGKVSVITGIITGDAKTNERRIGQTQKLGNVVCDTKLHFFNPATQKMEVAFDGSTVNKEFADFLNKKMAKIPNSITKEDLAQKLSEMQENYLKTSSVAVSVVTEGFTVDKTVVTENGASFALKDKEYQGRSLNLSCVVTPNLKDTVSSSALKTDLLQLYANQVVRSGGDLSIKEVQADLQDLNSGVSVAKAGEKNNKRQKTYLTSYSNLEHMEMMYPNESPDTTFIPKSVEQLPKIPTKTNFTSNEDFKGNLDFFYGKPKTPGIEGGRT